MKKSILVEVLNKINLEPIRDKDSLIFYTAAFGSGYNFDKFLKNKYNFKIYIFTDQIEFKKNYSNKFNIKIVNKNGLSNVLMNKIFKFLPHVFFPFVKSTIYFDAKKFPSHEFRKFDNSYDLIISKFNLNYQCIYKHYDDLVNKKIITDKDNFLKLINHYKKSKFPENFGLGDTSVIFRNNKNKNVNNMFEKILFYVIKFNIYRDQLLFMYLYWRKKKFIKFNYYNFDQIFETSKNARIKYFIFGKLRYVDRSHILFRILNKITLRFFERFIIR